MICLGLLEWVNRCCWQIYSNNSNWTLIDISQLFSCVIVLAEVTEWIVKHESHVFPACQIPSFRRYYSNGNCRNLHEGTPPSKTCYLEFKKLSGIISLYKLNGCTTYWSDFPVLNQWCLLYWMHEARKDTFKAKYTECLPDFVIYQQTTLAWS